MPSLNDWSLPLAKVEYLFEFTNNSPDLYQLSFNDNVIVSILNDNFITIANLDNNPYIFLNNFTYYILIKALEDNASLNYEYVNIENVNIDQIYSNNTNQAKYYSFVADTAGYYYITEFLGNNISFYLKGDSTNVDYIVSSNSNLVRYKIYLNANDKLYLGYNNAINYKFSISLADNYISWHQDGEKITSDFIVLRQGDQTTISVYITNENVSQNLSIETYSARGITFNPVNGLLQISNDAIPTEIESAPYHLFISFDDEIYSLYVYVTVNVNINMFVDNPNYIEYENDKNIIQGGVKIQVYAANPNDIFKITVKSKLGSGKVINYGPYILKDGDTIYVHLNSNALIEEKIDANGENVKTAINNIKAIFSIDYVEYEQKDIDNGTRTFKHL